jgi:tRNA (guanine-N7-)-methyltransferase
MARKKLIRFQENTEKPNLLQPGKPLYETIKGNWNSTYFCNDHSIVVELACGRGEYTTGLAAQIPGRNFIGVDVKGDRLWKGAVIAESQNLRNVAFLRTQIEQLENFFVPGEICEIWLTFPDPRPKEGDDKKRLTHPRFLQVYKQLIAPGGLVHLKTDNTDLFDYTLQTVQKFGVKDLRFTNDLYHSELLSFHYGLKTRYEQKYASEGIKINYLQFRFNV